MKDYVEDLQNSSEEVGLDCTRKKDVPSDLRVKLEVGDHRDLLLGYYSRHIPQFQHRLPQTLSEDRQVELNTAKLFDTIIESCDSVILIWQLTVFLLPVFFSCNMTQN